ncbi:MAG: peptidyl-prolyl cis-trans isomerase [Desulfonauticus sp.]|nr:peptidyl-prolyl cis-trans isomerase [Desulfonauticus sp.]
MFGLIGLSIVLGGEFAVASRFGLILAKVNGYVIDERIFENELKKEHKELLWTSLSPNVLHRVNLLDVLNKLIDKRLIIEEAINLGLDKDPVFLRNFRLFEINQLILRLRKEVVLDKISVSDAEIRAYFKKFYCKDGKFDEKKFKHVKRWIKRKLEKLKEKDLSDKFFAFLRKRARIWIDKKLVDECGVESSFSVLKDKIIARANGKPILAQDFIEDLKIVLNNRKLQKIKDKEKKREYVKKIKKMVLTRLITHELIVQEALKRKSRYLEDSNLLDILTQRKEQLLINLFKIRYIYPLARPSKKELREYYRTHKDKFRTPSKVCFSEVYFAKRKEAENFLNKLKQGASFEFLAKRVAQGSAVERDYIWVYTSKFSERLKKVLESLAVGSVSGVIADDVGYKVIKLKARKKGKVVEFSEVENMLKKIVGKQKFKKILSEYIKRLRKHADIKIYKKNLEKLKQKYWSKAA